MSNENIKALQDALCICGCDTGGCDGIMGPKTRDAIKKFQTQCEIGCDGQVGPITRSEIIRELGEVIVRAQQLKGFFEGGASSIEDEM